ncbi:MAG: S-methyl-5'-thioinosine phosphorylase [Gammaproteobacteria bacterium]|nr:S-methyl-5'-thioinosine phosphorylase [Gammaproteobacteria bacterium]
MTELAIIGGSGLARLQDLEKVRGEVFHTPYGDPSGELVFGNLQGHDVVFLARHGAGHTIPPHRINYRANLWALKNSGIKQVIAVCAVGGIREDMQAATVIIPDQIIDYTWSREHTLFDEDLALVTHIDFTEPYSRELRSMLIDSAGRAGVDVIASGTYGATQGPRLETAAEINRMENDGCHMVGMTGMPEAALARELGLDYAVCAVSANLAAGRGSGPIEMKDIEDSLSAGMEKVGLIIEQAVAVPC